MNDELKDLLIRALESCQQGGYRDVDGDWRTTYACDLALITRALKELRAARSAIPPAGVPAQASAPEVVPEGWQVQHVPPADWLTDEANAAMRFSVQRLRAPFCDKQGMRAWNGPTLDAAMRAAHEAMGLSFAAQVQPQASAPTVAIPRAVFDSTLDALRKAQMFKVSTALSDTAAQVQPQGVPSERVAALEEAARICEQVAQDWCDASNRDTAEPLLKQAAANIRAAANSQTQEGQQ